MHSCLSRTLSRTTPTDTHLPTPLPNQDLFTAMNRCEPRNAELYYRLARPLGRLVGSDPNLLAVTSAMADRAVSLRPEHPPYVSNVQEHCDEC